MPRNLDHRIEVVIPIEDLHPHGAGVDFEACWRTVPGLGAPVGRVVGRVAEEERAATPCADRVHAQARSGPTPGAAAVGRLPSCGVAAMTRCRRGRRCQIEHGAPARRGAPPPRPSERSYSGSVRMTSKTADLIREARPRSEGRHRFTADARASSVAELEVLIAGPRPPGRRGERAADAARGPAGSRPAS